MMKSKLLKKTLITSASVFLLLVAVLCIHIYIVTRPKAPTAATLAMARIDIKQPITYEDAYNITTWMYKQQGVDHVLCNAAMDNIVFTFHPALVDASAIAQQFRTAVHYEHAVRYIPTEKEMQGGCPVAATSYTYKIYSFFRHTF